MNVIKAKKGYKLFNGQGTAYEVSLGINDSPDNWREITIEEAKAWEEEQERIAEEERLAEEARLESERNS